MGRFLLLFALIPVLDLVLLVRIGARIGFLPTFAAVVLIGMLGASLARREGMRVLTRWQESLARGEVPEEGVLSGFLVLLGGLLLVAPGVITDVIGLSLVFPPTRRLVARFVRGRLESGIAAGNVHFVDLGAGPGAAFHGAWPGGRAAAEPGVIDVAGEEIVDARPRPSLPR